MGCDTFLAIVVALVDPSVSVLGQILVVSEFVDMFLDEVPRLPPAREVEFTIYLVPDTMPISRVPYWMA